MNSEVAQEFSNAVLNIKTLRSIDLSDCNSKRHHCKKLAEGLINGLVAGSNLQSITWDNDMVCSASTASDFVKSFMDKVGTKSQVKELRLSKVINSAETRSKLRASWKNKLPGVTLTLFTPDYSDEEEEDLDFTDESDNEGSIKSQDHELEDYED